MSKVLANQLPEHLIARLSSTPGDEVSDRAIVICSIDDHGHPHPAMLSGRELYSVDQRTIRLTAFASSRTARNLRARGRVTLILADHDGVFYIKGTAISIETTTAVRADFDVRIEEVLEDTPTADEAATITTGIRFKRPDA